MRRYLLPLLTCVGCADVFNIEKVFDAGSSGTGDGPAATCELSPGSPYVFFNADTPWQLAFDHCVSLDPNPNDMLYAHLAVVSSPDEAAQILAISVEDGDGVWVGYTDSAANPATTNGPSLPANFRWITTEGGVVSWAGSNPDNNNGSPYCAALHHADNQLHDNTCTYLNAYVCECDAHPLEPANY